MVRVDEQPGIHTLQRDGTTLPMHAGHVERRECTALRHGTHVLTGTLHLATGLLISPTVAETRTEADGTEHITRRVHTDPQAPFIMRCDQLKTHQSDTLVRSIASVLEDGHDLGVPLTPRILKRMPSRQTSLSDPTHRMRVVSPPQHWSWFHALEVWFRLFDHHLVRRGTVLSIADGKENIQRSIPSSTHSLANAWRWSVTTTTDIQRPLAKGIGHLLAPTDSLVGYGGERVLERLSYQRAFLVDGSPNAREHIVNFRDVAMMFIWYAPSGPSDCSSFARGVVTGIPDLIPTCGP